MDEKSKIHIENSSMNYLFPFFFNLFLKSLNAICPTLCAIIEFSKAVYSVCRFSG